MDKGIFLLLGSNEGDRMKNLEQAKLHLKEKATVMHASSVYQTAAWGLQQQPDFYNQVVSVETMLSAEQLLDELLRIETRMGRMRVEKWGPRIIDLDLLFYHQEIRNTAKLQLPHPGIPVRNFTLIPLAEIASDFVHPVSRKNIQTLLEESPDPLTVKRL